MPGGAFTVKGAYGVDTVAALTNAGYGLALVHICACEEFKHRKETNALTLSVHNRIGADRKWEEQHRAADAGGWVGVKLGFCERKSFLSEVNSSRSLKAEAVCRALHVLHGPGSALPPLQRF